MILSDRDIIEAIDHLAIKIDPFDKKNITPNGYDLSIEGRELKDSFGKVLKWTGDANKTITINPLQHFLVITREWIEMPENMTALLQIKTKYARKGVILSPGAVDAGFHGKLVLSMFNSSTKYLHIKCGDPICQILFVKMTSNAKKPYAERSGNYQNQNKILK